MANLLELLVRLAESIWMMLVDSAFLLLLGFLLAGIIHLLLNEKTIPRMLSGNRFVVILKSALIGVPLPLCSCSVLPVAQQLRRMGLSREATAAFLVSTPESGVDSMFLTYSLTDPLMTVARPITAFFSAMAAGLAVGSLHKAADSAVQAEPACASHCGCSEKTANEKSLTYRILGGIKYAYVNLMGDLAPYLFFGYLLAGLAALIIGNDVTAVPDSFGVGWGGYVGAIIVGLPLYVCATSSTPLAAVLLAAGFSPGAVLVFLLVGPATNLASLNVVRKILTGWSTLVYLAAIVVVSVLSGITVDWVYRALDFTPTYLAGEHHHGASIVAIVSAILFAAYVTFLTLKKAVSRLLQFFLV